MDENVDVAIAYRGKQDAYTPEELTTEICRVWPDLLRSGQGRESIAHILGVQVSDLNIESHPYPFIVENDTAGFFGVDLTIAIDWSAVHLLVPVLVGLAKDEVKIRFVKLWREVIKPKIDQGGIINKFGEERDRLG